MTTTERIEAAIKPILDEDRRADRERIAELERDAAAANVKKEWLDRRCDQQAVELCDFSDQIDELTEKCAALVVERNSLAAENAGLHRQCDDLRISMGRATPLRIDTDMSDPQSGKLLVVRLDADDVGRAWVPLGEMSDRGRETQNFWPEQRVGFLVETPAVGAKRTPKVGDKVRAKMSGRIGVVHKLFGGVALINQGGQMFEVLASAIEVIE